jgi:hypothetical protein
MVKIITTIFCTIIITNLLFAQQFFNKKHAVQYAGNFQIGIAMGDAEKNHLLLQIVNGIQYQQWFAGIGASIDQYGNKRSIPFFIALQKTFFNNNHQPFIYTNIGYNISWLKQNQKAASFANYKEINGLYYDVGIGYKYVFFKHTAVGVSFGYSLKQQAEQYSIIGFVPTPSQNFSDKYEYNFKRLIIKFNYWF